MLFSLKISETVFHMIWEGRYIKDFALSLAIYATFLQNENLTLADISLVDLCGNPVGNVFKQFRPAAVGPLPQPRRYISLPRPSSGLRSGVFYYKTLIENFLFLMEPENISDFNLSSLK